MGFNRYEGVKGAYYETIDKFQEDNLHVRTN